MGSNLVRDTLLSLPICKNMKNSKIDDIYTKRVKNKSRIKKKIFQGQVTLYQMMDKDV